MVALRELVATALVVTAVIHRQLAEEPAGAPAVTGHQLLSRARAAPEQMRRPAA